MDGGLVALGQARVVKDILQDKGSAQGGVAGGREACAAAPSQPLLLPVWFEAGQRGSLGDTGAGMPAAAQLPPHEQPTHASPDMVMHGRGDRVCLGCGGRGTYLMAMALTCILVTSPVSHPEMSISKELAP